MSSAETMDLLGLSQLEFRLWGVLATSLNKAAGETEHASFRDRDRTTARSSFQGRLERPRSLAARGLIFFPFICII